jgi:hypothetical protein
MQSKWARRAVWCQAGREGGREGCVKQGGREGEKEGGKERGTEGGNESGREGGVGGWGGGERDCWDRASMETIYRAGWDSPSRDGNRTVLKQKGICHCRGREEVNTG